MDSLISHISEQKFIKIAIESSYFFAADLCAKRFEEIAKCWNDTANGPGENDPAFEGKPRIIKSALPARYSSSDDATDGLQIQLTDPDKAIFRLNLQQPIKDCRIYQDGYRGKKNNCGGGNGNTRVCQLIKYRTGYDLGAKLDKKSLRNYIISHIWGHAVDPRYFTNLWNIAIVPAWANHLLD